MTRVLKIGGAALTDEKWLHAFAAQAARMSEPCVIVHGGGPEITSVSEQLGVTAEWHNGKRVTPPAALDAAAMVLTGRVNKRIVAALLDSGVDAMGLCGVDGGLIRAEIAHDGALGRVGRVTEVRRELIEWLIERGMTPVLSPISLAADGGSLNVNADEVAAAVASALGAAELIFLTDVDGVRVADVTRASLSVDESAALIATGGAWGGMAVKLNAAAEAVEAGIGRVRIGGLDTLTEDTAGTTVHAMVEVAA
ncbi:MAG: acetylglutamate kinase [Longimicrobiales bacterium]